MYVSSHLTPEGRFADALGQAEAALDVLTAIDPAELDPSVLGGFLLALTTQSRRVGAVQAAVADRFATSGVWAGDAAKSAHAWVSAQSNEPKGRVLGAVATGVGMRTHPQMAEAFAAGEVTARHVDVLATTARAFPSAAGHLEANADAIVDLARYMTAGEFAEQLKALCHLVDPGAVERDERKRDAETYLHLSRIADGMWRVDGLLPDEVGTQFSAIIQAVKRRLRAEAKQAEDQQHTKDNNPNPSPDLDPNTGQGGGCAQEPLADSADSGKGTCANPDLGAVGVDVFGNPIPAEETPAQAMDNRYGSRQNVDALRYLLNLVASVKNPDGTIALPAVNATRPVVHLTVDIESLLEESETKAAAWLERFGVPTSVISATKAGLLACDSTIEPMIMRDGQLVATLPSLQTVPAHLRKAVVRRDGECRINSCDAPIDEIHHLIYLSQGGPTTMANLAGLCWYHHHLIHHGHWTLTGDANGELTLTNTITGQQWTNAPPITRRT